VAQSFADLVEVEIASGKTKLPLLQGAAAKLQEMLANPPGSSEPLEQAISGDAVLASAVLRVANSSFYGGLAQVKTVRDSLFRLGIDQVTRIALVISQESAYRVRAPELVPLIGTLWRHALATALGAQWLARRIGRGDLSGEAFLAGMVHDIGKLLVIRVIDDLRTVRADFRPAAQLVTELLTSMHARHGAALAKEWNLPESFIRVIEHHHDPEPADSDTLLLSVRLADNAANTLGFGLGPKFEGQLAATLEAQALEIDEIAVAELEIQLEDSLEAFATIRT
jgi:putative nucleotidyltransferase with HDIG domain